MESDTIFYITIKHHLRFFKGLNCLLHMINFYKSVTGKQFIIFTCIFFSIHSDFCFSKVLRHRKQQIYIICLIQFLSTVLFTYKTVRTIAKLLLSTDWRVAISCIINSHYCYCFIVDWNCDWHVVVISQVFPEIFARILFSFLKISLVDLWLLFYHLMNKRVFTEFYWLIHYLFWKL